jgi:transposase
MAAAAEDDACRLVRKRGITAVIPVKEEKHRRNRGSAGGCPPVFDAGRYKERNTVERCFSKLKQLRAFATRCDMYHRTEAGRPIAAGSA